MNLQPATLLLASLAGYVVGAVAGLLFLRREKAANLFAFGCASLAALCGVVSCASTLATGAAAANQSFTLFPSLIPFVQFTVRLDPLGAFFGLIVSLLGLALSVYSLGYARGFYGRKSVGVLGALFNVLLLAVTLVFLASNAFFFLIAWEIMALTAYCSGVSSTSTKKLAAPGCFTSSCRTSARSA
jgi:hydrogenase-4 component B